MMKKTKGSIILTIILMTLVMFLGLSLLNISMLHNRVHRARLAHRVRSEFLHSTLISHLHRDTERIKNTRFDSAIEDIATQFNQSLYPDIYSDSFTLKKSFRFLSRDFGPFRLVRTGFGLVASDPKKRGSWKSLCTFNLITGDIPFQLVPVIINPPGTGDPDKEKWSRNISAGQPGHIVVSDHPAVFNIRQYLATLLNLDPRDFSLAEIASLYGKNRVEAGIWLNEEILDSLPVFIQGDVDCIRLGVCENVQVIRIRAGTEQLTIRYSPDHCQYDLPGSAGNSSGSRFLQKFIINGDVKSLESDGFPALAEESRPELIVLGNIVISSSITGGRKNPSEADAPFITILTSPSPFQNESRDSSLIFSAAGEVRVHGSLNISGTVLNENRRTILTGNLYCRDLKSRGTIEVRKTPFMPEGIGDNFFLKDISFIRDFRIDAVEEVLGDEQ